ncbi:sugar transferase [Novosphingobium album (ex Hu et al. 2023)]|uniref:Sugar transferase n=1 Tax=Novosphingobium album (ex Hu et al. 2023) TaxID=2930093 RepID=A0ABT0B438_9SPHN|nr:sugar transferase [Novosphingobium album (ex Hu et al. 2023)]MCJ2179809.1 sugar transferase [Novosphingobium album (ex Hu et al. 2023)]
MSINFEACEEQDKMATIEAVDFTRAETGEAARSGRIASACVSRAEAGLIIQVAEADSVIATNPPHGPYNQGQPRLTRLIDILGATGLIVILLPVLVLLAIVTSLTSVGSAFYAHSRIGKDGKRFKCYKFRSMYVGAEQRLAKLLESDPELRREWEAEHKLQQDPRVTPFGRLMRQTSLDELPQLFNVLKGDMSLVGPRPIVQDELARYGRYVSSYLAIKPGLTGLWQVSGRSRTSYRRRVAADHVYALNKCVVLDLRIIIATLPAVLMQRGAC